MADRDLPIAVDVMGGDRGPEVVVRGAVAAARALKIPVALVGSRSIIEASLGSSANGSAELISIVDAPEVITMDDSPSLVIRGKPRASVRVAFELVKEGRASAVVSTGNTGAMMAAGIFVIGTFPDIVRPAIATHLPRNRDDGPPVVLLDSGANIDCQAFQLVQFALMGHFYAARILGLEKPRVALLSNGSESSKGTDAIRTAAQTLGSLPGITYVGYVEGRDVVRDITDIVVCDGFVGNVLLKTLEGGAELVFRSMKERLSRSLRGKMALLLAKEGLRALYRDKLDPSAYGGAPLLGLREVGIVCHGSSNERAVENAVRVAKRLVDENLVSEIQSALAVLEETQLRAE